MELLSRSQADRGETMYQISQNVLVVDNISLSVSVRVRWVVEFLTRGLRISMNLSKKEYGSVWKVSKMIDRDRIKKSIKRNIIGKKVQVEKGEKVQKYKEKEIQKEKGNKSTNRSDLKKK